jgi:hypothetical protein
MDIKSFLRAPEKSLLHKIQQHKQIPTNPSLFSTIGLVT